MSSMSSSAAIDEFIKHYKESYYRDLALHAQHICEQRLSGSSIRAIHTSRAKNPDSLRKKVEKENAKRVGEGKEAYKDKGQIGKEIFDRAGVRIALYFPGQRDVVAKVIEKTFNVVTWIKHPDPGAKKEKKANAGRASEAEDGNAGAEGSLGVYEPKFAGYEARHAHVRFKKEDMKGISWSEEDVVEIQIQSVFLHAWAEVEHDITYKDLFGHASHQERLILDCLNGMVRSSELLLEQLHQLHKARTMTAKNRFRNEYELGEFLAKRTRESNDGCTFPRLYILGRFLEVVEKDTPEALGCALEALGFKEDTSSREEQLQNAKAGLKTRVERYKPFVMSDEMLLIFCIMDQILLSVKPGDEAVAQHETEGVSIDSVMDKSKPVNLIEEPSKTDRTYSSTCWILVSSLVWLKKFSPRSYDWRSHLEEGMTKGEKSALKFAIYGAERYDILRETKPDKEEREWLRILWEWFERQDGRSISSFVFRISKMGVLKDLSRLLYALSKS